MLHGPIANFNPKRYPDGHVMQGLGENPSLYAGICSDGMCLAGHNGVDIVAPHGTPLLAVEDGYIGDVKDTPGGYGKHLRLFADQKDGTVREWVYGHCSEITTVNGQFVTAGETIAKMGNTGFVVSGANPWWPANPYAGTHLHCAPRLWKLWNGTGFYQKQLAGRFKVTEVLNYQNGFFGCFDPLPLFGYPQNPTTPQLPLKPSEQIRAMAEKRKAEGHKDAAILFAIAGILAAWGN